MKIPLNERLMAAGSYLIFVPTLYIILSSKRRKAYLAQHAAQALVFWFIMGSLVLSLRAWAFHSARLDPLLFLSYTTFICLYLLGFIFGCSAFIGRGLKIPYLSDLARWLV